MSAAPPPSVLALGPLERDSLALLAVCTRPVSRSSWEQSARTAGLRAEGKRGLYGEAFKAVVARLKGAGAVEVTARDPHAYVVPDPLVPWAFEDARARGRLGALLAPLVPPDTYGSWYDLDQSIRFALALDDPRRLARALERLSWSTARRGDVSPLTAALTCAAPESWIARLPESDRDRYLRDTLSLAANDLIRAGQDVLAAAARSQDAEVRARGAIARALSGDADGARDDIRADATTPWELGALAVVHVTEGRWADALAAFERAATTKQGGRRARGLPPPLGVFDLLLAASPAGRPADAARLPARIASARPGLVGWTCASHALAALATFRATGRPEPVPHAWRNARWLDHLVCGLAARWMPDQQQDEACVLDELAHAADRTGYAWVARQLRALHDATQAEGSLASLTSDRAPWEIALDALTGAVAAPSLVPAIRSDRGEIVWVLEQADVTFDEVRFTARLARKRSALGAGIPASKLERDASLPMTPQDRTLAAALVTGRRYDPAPLRALLAAVGHPRVRDASGRPLAIERGTPEVRLHPTATGARIEVFPPAYTKSGVAIVREPGRLVVFERTETASRLAAIAGEKGLAVPREGLPRVAEAITAIAPYMTVRGADALGEAVGARAMPADGRIRVQLLRAGSAFRARVRVVPGGTEGPALWPGSEPATVLVAGAGGPRTLSRDLAAERRRHERLVDACPLLGALRTDGDELIADDLDTCLELLIELEAARGDDVLVEWPAGDPLGVPIARDERSLRVRIAGDAQWLSVDASLAVDETRVLAFADLAARVASARGKFVPLGDDQYLALTDKLRERLDALARVHTLSDGRGRASLAMLPAIVQWAEGTELHVATALERRLERLQGTLAATPRVPRALQAELRDYQREGFTFLARRASCGLGSCLADDMGLGKTVQALALLLARAKEGPAIVVAPTSVCRNWQDETRRFAPALAVHWLADAPDRAARIAAMKSGEVLLVSYGLLAASGEAIGAQRFATAVFDEAHALKNPDTRRAAAARLVCADAVVGLTGTPLENHLGELHALFDVLAPGLLGSREKFARAFSAPIAGGDRRATTQLRALVRPFLLRRTKAQVLDELPDKTEMTRVVAPNDDERAFYEALRRRAVERVEQAAATRGPQARIQVLAEITKLRRAAIDPRLVAGDDAPAGAKLDALAELVAELREEGHRALVFSQFLEVLDRAGERLAAEGARCVRLDGSMNAGQRAAAVDAFQGGQADVFLLSLRAGGLGMNLTAADYVIHVDPWWNPAVEDQATDRAHRIGQTRPVTVVRLVTEGTIEERVLRLHASKRALYADALGELDTAKKLDVAALVELMRDGVG